MSKLGKVSSQSMNSRLFPIAGGHLKRVTSCGSFLGKLFQLLLSLGKGEEHSLEMPRKKAIRIPKKDFRSHFATGARRETPGRSLGKWPAGTGHPCPPFCHREKFLTDLGICSSFVLFAFKKTNGKGRYVYLRLVAGQQKFVTLLVLVVFFRQVDVFRSVGMNYPSEDDGGCADAMC